VQIQKHLRLIGKTGEKKITCRLMPRLFCDSCYQYAVAACAANGGVPLPSKLTAHKSYWTRWAELQPLVDVLSEDFIKTMSAKIGNGRTVCPALRLAGAEDLEGGREEGVEQERL
jgi:hypothetical protein